MCVCVCVYTHAHTYIYIYIYIYIDIPACSRRYPSTMKCRGNDVQLESAAVVEVQMKLRSHWQLLCQFKRQFTHQRVGQGEQHRWVYRASHAVREARETSKDGCTGQGWLYRRQG